MLLSLSVFDGEPYTLGCLLLERCVLRWDLVSALRASGKDSSTFWGSNGPDARIRPGGCYVLLRERFLKG